MFSGRCVTVSPLQPEEVQELRDLIKTWCAQYGCDPKGALAQDRAKKVLLAYGAGVRDTAKLLGLIRPF